MGYPDGIMKWKVYQRNPTLCRRVRFQFVFFLLVLHLLPSSTRAFVHNRNTDHPTFLNLSGNTDSTSQDDERQDAYGRTIPNEEGSRSSTTAGGRNNEGPSSLRPGREDPLRVAAAAELPATALNLEPLVVCGPSGVGKGTVIAGLRARFPPDVFGVSVSHTTRPPRPGERHGEHYHFTTHAQIQTDIARGDFVEHAEVHGNYYGTSKDAIAVLQQQHHIPILDIDVQGVQSVKASGLPCRYLFLAPPSLAELEDRLRGRHTESDAEIALRLSNAATELDYGTRTGNFDRIVVNEEVDTTVEELVQIVLEWYPQLQEISVATAEDATTTDADDTQHTTVEQKTAPTKSSPKQPSFDFLAKSDQLMQFPSVRKGHHGMLQVTDRKEDTGDDHGYYTVDNEEPDDQRGYPKLGTTNPTIVLDGRNDEDEIAY